MNETRTVLNIACTLAQLRRTRPIFHLEADFQHALAWQFHLSGYDVRLEYKLYDDTYVDIWFPKECIAIELKYLTTCFTKTVCGENFKLKNQSAQDTRRYDFLKDIQRIETGIARMDVKYGYAILLTNDKIYWEDTGRRCTNFEEFRIHEGVTLSGKRVWAEKTACGTKRNREDPINLIGEYKVCWQTYCDFGEIKGELKYLAIPVGFE